MFSHSGPNSDPGLESAT